MLSYQHIYHAGNAADLQKHLWLLAVLSYLQQKDNPFCWIDTHSGRGLYDLQSAEAQKIAEYESGIAPLLTRYPTPQSLPEDAPQALKLYLTFIGAANRKNKGALRYYPGSAWLAAKMLRPDDRLHTFELHPQEYEHLRHTLSPFGKAVAVKKEDGYKGLETLTPPAQHYGGVLIDPSYEIKEEYQTVARAVESAARIWPQGVYMIWYPILPAARHEAMCEALQKCAQQQHLEYVRDEWKFEGAERGLQGTGMFILNPPQSCINAIGRARQILEL